MASIFCYFKYCKWNPRKIIPTSEVWNPNSQNFLSRNLKNPKSAKLNFHKNLLSHSFRRCGNCERFCLSCNLSAFVAWFQQSRIREFRTFFRQESHRPPQVRKCPYAYASVPWEGWVQKPSQGEWVKPKKSFVGEGRLFSVTPRKGPKMKSLGTLPISLKSVYYSFKIFPRFWLVKTTRIIHHKQLLLTKNSVILNQWHQKCSPLQIIEPLTSKWRQKCSPVQIIESLTSKIIEPLTEKTWGQGSVIQQREKWPRGVYKFERR